MIRLIPPVGRFTPPKSISARLPGVMAQRRLPAGDFCGGEATNGRRVYTTTTLRRDIALQHVRWVEDQANQQLVATVIRVSAP